MSRRPLKVLHLVNGEFFAGAERVQDLLGLYLPEYGYELRFASLKDGVFAKERQAIDVPLQTFPMRSKFDISVAFAVGRFAKAQDCSVLHAHTPRSALIANVVSRLTGLPFIYHVHGPTVRDTENKYRNYLNALVERLSINRASFAIPVSSHAREYAIQIGYPEPNLREVLNGVPEIDGRENPDARGDYTIGAVALFRPRKGVEVLLDAFARFSGKSQQICRLHMIGDFESASYERDIKKRASRLGIGESIEWLGYTDAVNDELKKLSVFVLPSLYGEGLPMVVLEAMAVGLPILATRAGGVGDAIEDGQNGLLIDPNDADAMCESLVRLQDDSLLAERLAASARRTHCEKFSANAMAEGVAAVYDEILGATD